MGEEGANDQWQISVRWCCCSHWETSGCMRDSPPSPLPPPPAPRSSHNLYCTSSSSFWVVLQENVRHQPLNMCLNDISPVCVPECVFPRAEWVFVSVGRVYWDVTDQIRGAKCYLFLGFPFLFLFCFEFFFLEEFTFKKRQIMMGHLRFSFPPCVDDLLCPDSVVLTACLCSFCHTKATSSASAHNCLIPLDAKLELFALLQMNMGILRRVQIAILI